MFSLFFTTHSKNQLLINRNVEKCLVFQTQSGSLHLLHYIANSHISITLIHDSAVLCNPWEITGIDVEKGNILNCMNPRSSGAALALLAGGHTPSRSLSNYLHTKKVHTGKMRGGLLKAKDMVLRH